MPPARSSVSLLSFGTGLLLTLPAPALAAAPDPGIDWQAEVAAAKARPARSSAPARPAKRPRKPSRPTLAAPTTDAPSVEPDPPVVPPDPTPPPPVADAPGPAPVTPREPTTAPPPPPRIAAPRVAATPVPRARAELVAGSLLAAGGFAALGVLANGLYVHRISERELARDGDHPPQLLAPIERQHDQSETRIAAGAVAGAVGLGLGAALIAAGVRELRLSRRAHARVRVVPTLTGLQLGGRF